MMYILMHLSKKLYVQRGGRSGRGVRHDADGGADAFHHRGQHVGHSCAQPAGWPQHGW